jgi:hypothetical protein
MSIFSWSVPFLGSTRASSILGANFSAFDSACESAHFMYTIVFSIRPIISFNASIFAVFDSILFFFAAKKPFGGK